MNTIESHITESARNFRELIWPEVSDFFPPGRGLSIEELSAGGDLLICQVFDQEGGTDHLHITKHGVLFIASRVHYWPTSRNNITIRTRSRGGGRTEWDKILYWHRHPQYSHPVYNIQGHITSRVNGKFLNASITKTMGLVEYVLEMGGPEEMDPFTNRDGTQFIKIYWSQYQDSGKNIVVYPQEKTLFS